MDIFNRPPSISEDTLHYTIYPPLDSSDKASVTALAASISHQVTTILPNFVWHRDAFEIKLVQEQENTGSWILEGRMRVGDSVDDEWCTVWLLKEISSKWDVAISVYDSDGEFLLIEAAEELPSWVKPTNSENRVWIYNSRIHLIPLSHISPESRKKTRRKLPGAADSDDEGNESSDPESFITIEDAVRLVRDLSVNTLAPSAVEKIVWRRISGYPTSLKSHVHVTKVHLPIDIAKALSVYPSLVQKAVEAFYTRDAIQLRAAHRMSRFSPGTCVLTSVKLTRTAYAQLVGQKFFPPKVFGQWKEVEGTPEWRWRDVGMKIAVGFEMFYQESKGRPNTQNVSVEGIKSSAEANKEALRRNPEYQKYIKNLVSVGYFKGELEGSELWNESENKAAISFIEVRRTDDATRQSFASQVDQGLASVQRWPIPPVQEEENDDWLTIDGQEFDKGLEASLTGIAKNSDAMDVDPPNTTESPEDKLASEQAKKLKDLATKVEDFIEGEGDLEGARFEDEDFSDEPYSDDEESSDSEQDEETKLAAKKIAMNCLVPALEPSEYGQMPATYHRNSQRVISATVTTDAEDNFEGHKKSPESQTKSNLKTRPIRPPIIPRDKYDGVDSDDETEEEDLDDESEEDRPQVVGDIEIDMEEEEEEFLEFSRQALGISDEQWQEIVKDRRGRGAFLPQSVTTESLNVRSTAEKAENPRAKTHIPRIPEPGPRPNVNPELDSFEAVMKALDAELLQHKSMKPPAKHSSLKSKGKAKEDSSAMTVDENDIDIEAAMDAELKEALQDAESDSEEPMDYNMIKNFLESYKSQAGLSGPVSNLAGRLQPGMKLPRDDV